jgi:hypothetical protein
MLLAAVKTCARLGMIEAVPRFAPFHVVSCLKAPNQSGEHFIDRYNGGAGRHSLAGGFRE